MDPSDGRLDSRERRIASNEALFREVNERVKEVSDRSSPERIEFLCECGDETCTESIQLSRGEYERLRSDPVLFGVKPGHGIPDVEEVVADEERFQIVRKFEDEASIARATDPRR
jgi:hypothetical protein